MLKAPLETIASTHEEDVASVSLNIAGPLFSGDMIVGYDHTVNTERAADANFGVKIKLPNSTNVDHGLLIPFAVHIVRTTQATTGVNTIEFVNHIGSSTNIKPLFLTTSTSLAGKSEVYISGFVLSDESAGWTLLGVTMNQYPFS